MASKKVIDLRFGQTNDVVATEHGEIVHSFRTPVFAKFGGEVHNGLIIHTDKDCRIKWNEKTPEIVRNRSLEIVECYKALHPQNTFEEVADAIHA